MAASPKSSSKSHQKTHYNTIIRKVSSLTETKLSQKISMEKVKIAREFGKHVLKNWSVEILW